MHLGDFDTQQWEIAVLCERHIGWFPRIRRILWSDEDGKKPLLEVLSLTENAWVNRMKNHPNVGGTEVISIPVHSCTFCSRLYRTKKEAKLCRERDIRDEEEWKRFEMELMERENDED